MALVTSGFQYPDDIVRGCVKYLLGIPSITQLVGSDNDGAYIFEGTPGVLMQGRSMDTPGAPVTCIVVFNAGSWGAPSPGMTARFPKIGIEIWADPPRDENRNVTRPQDARVAADYLSEVVDYYMNRTARGVVMFGDVPTWDSNSLGAISYLPSLPSNDHTIMGTVYYALQTAAFFSPS